MVPIVNDSGADISLMRGFSVLLIGMWRAGQARRPWHDGTVNWLTQKCRTGAWKCGVMCMALSSTPRYAVVVYNIEMYGSVSLLCIFDNYRVNYHEWI